MRPGALTEPLTLAERAVLSAPACPYGCAGPADYTTWRLVRPELGPGAPEQWEATYVSCFNPECPGRAD